MKTLLTILGLFQLASPAAADRIGNGGGGSFDEQTGEYKTFHGAGFVVEPAYLTDKELPEIVKLRALVKKLGLAPGVHAGLQQWLVPSYDRKFLKVLASKFSREDYEKIKDEYRKVFRDDRINIAIFAITDTSEKVTYLLPEFWKLSESDRISILFHEALWLIKPDASYKDILRVDDYMKRFLSDASEKSQFQLIAALDQFLPSGDEDSPFGGRASHTPVSLPGYAFGRDQARGALKGLVSAGGAITLGQLFGKDGLSCYLGQSDRSSDSMDTATGQCGPLLRARWLELSEKFPDSLFLQALVGAHPVIAQFNSVGSGNVIAGLSLGAGTQLVLTQKELYNGLIFVETNYKTTRRECSSGLFGRHCTNREERVRIRIPLMSFSDRVYIRELDPPSWSTLRIRD